MSAFQKRSYPFVLCMFAIFACITTLSTSALASEKAKAAKKTAPAPAAAKKAPAVAKKAVVKKAVAKKDPVQKASKAASKKGAKTNKDYNLPEIEEKKSPTWDRPYLFAAYGIVMLALIVYLFLLTQRLQATNHKIASLKQRITELEEEQE